MFEIGRVSHTRPHLLADTAEIAIAFGSYAQISGSDLISLMKSTPKPSAELLPLEEADLDDDDNRDDLGGVEINSRDQSYVDEAFRQIQFRVAAFGPMYPFKLDGDILTLKRRLTIENKLYMLLLACSRTRSFKSPGTVQKLANAFEEVCAQVLKKIVSQKGAVYMFGPSTGDRKKIFGSDLRKAIPKLVSFVGMRLKAGWERNYSGSGDGKMDLIGVYNFDSRASGVHVILGQCASMEDENDWQKKRQEAQFSSRQGSFDYIVEPQSMLFIPGCYRQPDGDWVNTDFVSGVITIDRLRILSILKGDLEIGALTNRLYRETSLKIAA